VIEPFQTMTPFWLPTINTALLLSSGVTLTIAHHALRAGHRGTTVLWMWLTVLLGATFVCVQGYEYFHAYTELNLKLSSGAYGSTFFMLTGFHGFHVIVGMLMLLFITLRLMKGHFTADRHFGFEGAAWYWHFVDVVWLGLYTWSTGCKRRKPTASKKGRASALAISGTTSADSGLPDVAELPGKQDAHEQQDKSRLGNRQRACHVVVFARPSCRRAHEEQREPRLATMARRRGSRNTSCRLSAPALFMLNTDWTMPSPR
jgi:hypothetical protein